MVDCNHLQIKLIGLNYSVDYRLQVHTAEIKIDVFLNNEHLVINCVYEKNYDL